MQSRQVEVFMDYENIRVGLWRHFQKRIPHDIGVDSLLESIRGLANEIGSLYEAHIFGDWTMRGEDAKVIEATPQFRAHLVLRSASKKDRTDPAMNFAIDDAFRDRPQIENILLCAGDSCRYSTRTPQSYKSILSYRTTTRAKTR